jgi:nicotinate-nucleotide pyrophosphorylase
MRKQMMEDAAYEVATQVRAVEDSIEAALIEIAELQAKMVHARVATKAGFANTHSAFEQLALASSSLVAAGGGIAHCHEALAETRKSIPGLRTVGFGDVGDCPPKQESAGLRVVA